jgi:SAM-dependent methyltransferase
MWIGADRDLHFFNRNVGDSSSIYHSVICDAKHPALAAGSCDAVVAQHVIEHFEEPDRILRGWATLLRKGGTCVLVTPNRLFPHLEWFDDPTHRTLFSGEELSALMRRAGFAGVALKRLVPWLGSERTVYLAARLQRRIPGHLNSIAILRSAFS